MSHPKGDKKKGGQTGRPATKTMEPPAKKSSEQVPSGDDSDINEGNDPEQRTNVDDEAPARKEPRTKDQESRGDENSGCAC